MRLGYVSGCSCVRVETDPGRIPVLLRMRKASELREKRNKEAHDEMEKLALRGQQQQQEYKDTENRMLRLEEEIKLMANALEDKEEMVCPRAEGSGSPPRPTADCRPRYTPCICKTAPAKMRT